MEAQLRHPLDRQALGQAPTQETAVVLFATGSIIFILGSAVDLAVVIRSGRRAADGRSPRGSPVTQYGAIGAKTIPIGTG